MDPGDLLAELLAGPGRRQRELAQVELDVEVRVVDPVGTTEPQRHLDQALPKRRCEVQPGLEDGPDGVEVPDAAGSGARVEEDQAADVPHRGG